MECTQVIIENVPEKKDPFLAYIVATKQKEIIATMFEYVVIISGSCTKLKILHVEQILSLQYMYSNV